MARKDKIPPNRLMTKASKTSSSTSLEMTDYFFLFSLFLLMGWALDPMLLQLENLGGIKRIPSIFLFMNIPFILAGRNLFPNRAANKTMMDVISENRWLLAYCAFVVCGSLYAKFGNRIDETFLTMGLYVLVAPLAHWYTITSKTPWKLLRSILFIFIFWACISLTMQFVFFRKIEMFHGREHLVLPLVGAALYYAPKLWLRVLGVAIVVAGAIAVSKITAFIIATISLTYMFAISLYSRIRFQRDPLFRFFLTFAFVSGVTIVVVGCVVAYFQAGAHAPTGNVSYRAYTYAMAWDKFLASPIWGSGFTKSAVIYFDLFKVETSTQYLPTHSDPLDVLAGGGLIGALFWLGGLFPKIKTALADVSVHAYKLPWQERFIHQSFLMSVIAGLVVCSFNPILNLANTAAIYWLAFGCLLTTTQLCKRSLAHEKS